MGCVLKKEYWRITVLPPVGVETEIANDVTQCYFSKGDLMIHLPQKQKIPYELTVVMANGTIIHQRKYADREVRLSGLKGKYNQLYIVTINDGKEKKVFKLMGK